MRRLERVTMRRCLQIPAVRSAMPLGSQYHVRMTAGQQDILHIIAVERLHELLGDVEVERHLASLHICLV